MKPDTDSLIASLSTGLQPVTPLRSPVVRALGSLLLIAVLAAWPLWRLADLQVFVLRNGDVRTALECAASLLTGIVATVAAFHLAVPGREGRWARAPLAPLALWIAAAGAGCLRNGIGRVNWDCLLFVVVAGVPLTLLLFGLLRRARPISPGPVIWSGGLAAAGIAAFLLQFFHPFDVTVMDLMLHAVAVLCVLGVARLAGLRALGSPH
jgi:hypothetical protein